MESAAALLESGSQDLLWFNKNLATIKQQYNDQFIAVCDKQIVAKGKTLDALMQELKRNKADLSRVIIQHISTIQQIL